jgi:hypothetical protein
MGSEALDGSFLNSWLIASTIGSNRWPLEWSAREYVLFLLVLVTALAPRELNSNLAGFS